MLTRAAARREREGGCRTKKLVKPSPRSARGYPRVRLKLKVPSPPPPLQELLPCFLDMAKSMIEAGPGINRGTIEACLKLCFVCKEASELLVQDPQFPLLVTLFNALLGRQGAGFWDGVHPSLNLFGGGTVAMAADIQRFQHPLFDVAAVHAERYRTAAQLLVMSHEQIVQLSEDYYYDAGVPGVPLRVSVFLGQLRRSAQTLRSARPPRQFPQCGACGKTTFWDEAVDDSEADAAAYWSTAGGCLPGTSGVFCSRGCWRAYRREEECAMCTTEEELEQADAPSDKLGPARVPLTLRAALKRNKIIATRMRCPLPEFRFLTNERVAELRAAAVQMLSVDLVLLVSAASIVESAAGRSRNLPPSYFEWRQFPIAFLHSVTQARILYLRFSSQPTLLTDSHLSSRVLVKARNSARVIFD